MEFGDLTALASGLGARAQMAALTLLWLMAMFVPLERSFPAWPMQRSVRVGFFTDLAFFLGQHLVFVALALAAITWLSAPLQTFELLHAPRAAFGALPFALQVVLVWVCGDLIAYGWHRLQHASDLWWRFHEVHHSSEAVDWLAAYREHPLDGLMTQLAVNMPAIALGFDVGQVLGLVVLRGAWAVFIHSNVRVPLGPLAYLLGSPALHHWHHARGRAVGNYANLAPWIDVVFGTYYRPPHEPEEVGLDTPLPQRYITLLLAPFRRAPQSSHTSPSSTRGVSHEPQHGSAAHESGTGHEPR